MISFRVICLLPVMLVVSCATDSKNKQSSEAEFKPLSQRLEESNGYVQDSSGNWVPRGDKRSSFESQGASPYFKGEYNKKNYQTDQYSKKSWWGNKEYGRKSYAGDTDGSRFQKASQMQGRGARESGGSADLPDAYQTGNYATSDARETSVRKVTKTTDAETDNRRSIYSQPEIIDWREQRALTLEQSKGILGR